MPITVWNEEEIAILERLFRNGRPDRAIAFTLGRSERSVACKRYKLGLRNHTCPKVNSEAQNPTFGQDRYQLRKLKGRKLQLSLKGI